MIARYRFAAELATVGWLSLSCGSGEHGVVMPQNVASVRVTAPDSSIYVGQTLQLGADPRTPGGVSLPGRSVTWSLNNAIRASISQTGLLTAVSAGAVRATAEVEGVTGVLDVTINLVPIALIVVSPFPGPLRPGEQRVLSAALYDSAGEPLVGRTVTWSSTDTAVAVVSSVVGNEMLGNVTARVPGSVTIQAQSDDQTGSRTGTVAPVTFGALFGTNSSTCSLTVPPRIVYCWGSQGSHFGDPNSAGGPFQKAPVLGGGGVVFSWVTLSISGGSFGDGLHTCGLTNTALAFCWGANDHGQLGRGNSLLSTTPVAVSGGRTFLQLSLGRDFTCGLTTLNQIFCWGANESGQFGTGDSTFTNVPRLAFGGATFTAIAAGTDHVCALDGAGAAYCAGANTSGQLGDSSTTGSPTPVRVKGGLSFSQIYAGHAYNCALTATGAAYCWGGNAGGELGNGTFDATTGPSPVGGGHTFAMLTTSVKQFVFEHTCGVTTTGEGYCWGFEALGNGMNVSSATPVPISGGLTWGSLTAGAAHSCGLTTSLVAYCWGHGGFGALGVGDTDDHYAPVKVLYQPN